MFSLEYTIVVHTHAHEHLHAHTYTYPSLQRLEFQLLFLFLTMYEILLYSPICIELMTIYVKYIYPIPFISIC